MSDYSQGMPGKAREQVSEYPVRQARGPSLSPPVESPSVDFQRAIFAVNAPAWCWHVHDSRVDVNAVFEEVFGLAAHNLSQLLSLLQQDYRERLLMALGRSLRRRAPFSMTVILADSDREMSVWCSPVTGGSGEMLLIGTMLDVERQSLAAGDALSHTNMELQLLLDSMRSVIWYLDRWGMVQHGNQKAANWVPLDRALGRSFLEVAPDWDDVAERHREIMQVIRTGVPQLGSLESRQIQGRKRWYRVDKIPTRDATDSVSGLLLVINDVTEVVEKELALKESEARYRAFIANSADGMFRFDLAPPLDVARPKSEQLHRILDHARLAEGNQVLARMFGVSGPEILHGLTLRRALPPAEQEMVKKFVTAGCRLEDYEFDWVDREGDKRAYQVSAIGIVEDGLLHRIWGTSKDITEKKRYLDRLEYQATHDSLTLLPNRNKLYRELDLALKDRGNEQKMALMLLDLDRFKEINDALGHHAGDRLLKQIGPRLEMELAEFPSVVARLGGDEFAILLTRIRNNQQAVVIAHRVLDALRQPFEVEGLQTEISASVGITICPDHADNVSALMRYADVAMYHAKSERTGVSVYQTAHNPHTPKRLALISDLGRAVRENQLQLYFQPKVNLQRQQVYGFEALLRWQHPELGFVPPDEFIPLVEMTDLVNPMTQWVLEHVIAQAKAWQEQGHWFSVAANLSPQNLMGDWLVDLLAELLERYQLPPELLELELTESTIMLNQDRALKVLQGIDALGVTLAIDDFGTGYSSLAYLKRLPVRTLKIDGSFVTSMLEDEQDRIIVNSTINLAHNLGLSVVAEGVEDEAVLKELHALQCDRAQGYFIARPQSAASIVSWLAQSQWYRYR